MDHTHFETLLRSLSTAPSRRDALRLLGAVTLGGLLPIGAASSEAKTGGHGRGKGKHKKRRGGTTSPPPPTPSPPPPTTLAATTHSITATGANLRRRHQERQRDRHRLRWVLPPMRDGQSVSKLPRLVPVGCAKGRSAGRQRAGTASRTAVRAMSTAAGRTCARCDLGKGCAGAVDCSTSRCVNNVCRVCILRAHCPTGCTCNGNTGACVNLTPVQAAACVDCPRYSFCSSNQPDDGQLLPALRLGLCLRQRRGPSNSTRASCWGLRSPGHASVPAANVEALRLDRVATGRAVVVMVDGRYHGHADEMLNRDRVDRACDSRARRITSSVTHRAGDQAHEEASKSRSSLRGRTGGTRRSQGSWGAPAWAGITLDAHPARYSPVLPAARDRFLDASGTQFRPSQKRTFSRRALPPAPSSVDRHSTPREANSRVCVAATCCSGRVRPMCG